MVISSINSSFFFHFYIASNIKALVCAVRDCGTLFYSIDSTCSFVFTVQSPSEAKIKNLKWLFALKMKV